MKPKDDEKEDLQISPPPVFTSLEQLYPADLVPAQTQRYSRIRNSFVEKYNIEPEFYARSPGRVNLIGEHIDYSGYSVLPMALDRDIVIAVATFTPESGKPAQIHIANSDSKYPTRTFDHVPSSQGCIPIDHTIHEWSNYFKCGYKGVCEELGLEQGVGMYCLVDGVVPAGAGVSSSAAFVCSSALATLTANKGVMTKGQLTLTSIRGEKYAGVQCGGMDQSISVLAQPSSVLLIHFHPELKAERVVVPDVTFVVANTLVTSDKHVTAPRCYNLRVVETRLASALMSRRLGLEKECPTLRAVQEAYMAREGLGSYQGNEVESLKVMSNLVDKHIRREPFTREDLATEFGMTVAELETKYVQGMKIEASVFELYKRSKHVFEESRRVFMFQQVCNGSLSFSGDVLQDMGMLMNASQDSCRELFECSCKELDELTSIAREAGALGSRLTGAGWGGCSISLVPSERLKEFMEVVKQKYYFVKYPELKERDAVDGLADIVFASRPWRGSSVLRN